MALMEQIENDYKQAFKTHHEVKVNMLRMVKSALKNAEIAARHHLDDDEVITVMTREAKKRRESIAMFERAGRTDLVQKENAELQELMFYLPTQMSDSEIETLVRQVVTELHATPQDFGQVMKTAVARAKGQADGQRLSAIVKSILK